MSRIFISHSSANNAVALAVAQWLRDNGWDDFFLDVAPTRGLTPGERWQEALRAAAHRCEAVLFLISPAWRDSRWCLAEFLLAKTLGKVIFGVLVAPTPIQTLLPEMTAEWQLCDLATGDDRVSFHVRQDPIVPSTQVSFARAGLERLKLGLQKAGLDASTFRWPPPNRPELSVSGHSTVGGLALALRTTRPKCSSTTPPFQAGVRWRTTLPFDRAVFHSALPAWMCPTGLSVRP